jgi:Protein of unknown function (DUF3800)
MDREFIIYCDESASFGATFSNFYGGALIRSSHIDQVRRMLAVKKVELNLFREIKWQKVTANYLDKYREIMDLFFDMVQEDILKIRIMFTQNIYVPLNLTAEHREHEYFILYYQFIKHAFGLIHSNDGKIPIRVRLLLDQMPSNEERRARFRGFVSSLTANPQFRSAGIKIHAADIVDVVSHNHDILQCLDVILGSINFRLNDLHLAIPPGKKRRGKRTRAKESLYNHMNERMCGLRPRFNIGVSTGIDGDLANRWRHSYRHWRFLPSDFEIHSARQKVR